MAKTYDASVFSPPPFSSQRTRVHSRYSHVIKPHSHKCTGGRSNSLFPLTHREKQTTATQTKKNVVLSGRQPKHYNTHGAMM